MRPPQRSKVQGRAGADAQKLVVVGLVLIVQVQATQDFVQFAPDPV